MELKEKLDEKVFNEYTKGIDRFTFKLDRQLEASEKRLIEERRDAEAILKEEVKHSRIQIYILAAALVGIFLNLLF